MKVNVFFLMVIVAFVFGFQVANSASIDVDIDYLKDEATAKLIMDDLEYTPTIKWFKDGDEVKGAFNETQFSLNLKDDEKVNLKAVLYFADNKVQVLEKTISKPNSFIIWEPVSFVPFSFSVSPGVSDQGRVRAEFVSNEDLKPEKTLYLWYINGQLRPDISGMGKRVVVFNLPAFEKGALVELELQDSLSLKKIGGASTYIEYNDPEILFYEKDKYGSWSFIPKKEIYLRDRKEILAVPFGITYNYLFDDSLLWSVFVDGVRTVQEEYPAPFMELSSKEKKDASLQINIKHKELDLQRVSANLLILQKGAQDTESDIALPDFQANKSGFGI